MFTGYKTYIVAAILVGLGVMKFVGFDVPEEVWMILTGLGFGALRAALDE